MSLLNGTDYDDIATAVLFFAHHIGININEEESLMHIASKHLQDLPEGWELGIPASNEPNAGIPYFFDMKTGNSVWKHPLEKKILIEVISERAKLQRAPNVKIINRRAPATSRQEKSEDVLFETAVDIVPFDSALVVCQVIRQN